MTTCYPLDSRIQKVKKKARDNSNDKRTSLIPAIQPSFSFDVGFIIRGLRLVTHVNQSSASEGIPVKISQSNGLRATVKHWCRTCTSEETIETPKIGWEIFDNWSGGQCHWCYFGPHGDADQTSEWHVFPTVFGTVLSHLNSAQKLCTRGLRCTAQPQDYLCLNPLANAYLDHRYYGTILRGSMVAAQRPRNTCSVTLQPASRICYPCIGKNWGLLRRKTCPCAIASIADQSQPLPP